MNGPLTTVTVPERFIGLWRRRLLETQSVRDARSDVWWLQTGNLYADLRQPPGSRPSKRTSPQQLALQQGFAGTLEVQGDVLTWHRWLDFQPPSGVADVGRVHFEDGQLIEEGVLVPYREVWECVAAASQDRVALALHSECIEGGEWRERRGVLVVLGDYFMFALDRGLQLSRSGDIKGRNSAFAVFRLDCEISFGVRNGRVPWEIQRSTVAERAGMSLQAVHGLPELDEHGQWLQTVPLPASVRRWRAVELGSEFRGFG